MSVPENINYWFLEVVPDKLQELADKTTTSPKGMSLSEWKETLEQMVFLFREANLETCTKYQDILRLPEEERSREQNAEIESYLDACKTEGLNRFNQYFWCLDD